jgi:phage tail-like protein
MARITKSSPTLSLKLSSQKQLNNISPLHQEFVNLRVTPGEYNDILVQIKNLWDQTLNWRIEVDGDFPAEWCHWNQSEIREIVSGEKIEETIRFDIPSNFFEVQLKAKAQNFRLKLDYQSKIRLYVGGSDNWELVGYEIFYLAIRPPDSYIDFLPVFYREVDFLERFLAIIEQAFDPAVQALDTLWAYLDPLTAPEAMLPFLAQWVGWELSDRLTIKQQRRLIRHATTLYRWHGTRYGLRFYLHLYTGLPLDEELPEAEKHICIQELYSTGLVLGKTYMGIDSMLGGGKKYHFDVILRVDDSTLEIDEKIVREIVERERPAFSSYNLEIRVVLKM